MPIVRAMTFFIPVEDWSSLDFQKYEEYINRSLDIVSETHISPWTIRLVLPPVETKIELEKYRNIVLELYDRRPSKDLMLHAAAIPSDSGIIDGIMDILGETNRLFSTILVRESTHIDRLVDKIYLYEGDYSLFTRISMTHLKWLQTPYFPSTTNVDNVFGFALALRYVDLFDKYLSGNRSVVNYLEDIRRMVEEYEKEFYGVDLSLSPWMEESVAELVEKHFDTVMGEPGSYQGVYRINNAISRLASETSVPTLGFNEIMLAVGEDNLLKKRVEEGTLRLGVLEGLANVCISGLDMVAIERDRRLLIKTLEDMDYIARRKGLTIGTRLIPVELDKDKVDVERFGVIPVIKI